MRGSEMTQTVTLWNRWRDGDGRERWQRSLLCGVWVQDKLGEAVRHAGAASSSARRIGPVSVSELLVLVPVRAGYLSPGQWRQATERVGCWTLQPGDLLAVGDCPLELTDGVAPLCFRC